MDMRAMMTGLAVAALAGGAAAAEPPRQVVDPATTVVEGWLSARGEPTLFPVREEADYDPYPEDEAARCVSLVDATGKGRKALARLDGRRVTARGKAVAYDSLKDGDEPGDALLGRKTYDGEVVINGCTRTYVFVATRIEAAR